MSFTVFVKDYPPLKAAGISLFHSVAAFNNSGFDILGDFQNMIPYQSNVMLNLVTCGLIIFGGIGFLVIRELWMKKFRWRKLSMHAKIVISVSIVLIAAGTLLIKANGGCYLDGRLFPQRFGQNSGIFHVSPGKFYNFRPFDPDRADVYRGVRRDPQEAVSRPALSSC